MKRKKRHLTGIIFIILISLCYLCFAQAGKDVPVPTQAEVLLILNASPSGVLPSVEELGKLWLKGPYLASGQLDTKYGPSKEAVKKVKAFARQYKLGIMWRKWRVVKLTGSIEDIFKAFALTLKLKTQEGQICFCVPGQKEVPKELKDVVVAVMGLRGISHQHRISHPFELLEHEKETQEASPGKISRPAFTPPQLAGLYNYPNLDGEGECIGVVALAGQYKMEDIETYFKEIIGLPKPEIINVNINEPIEPPSPKDSLEVTLDIEVAASIAPKAKIVVYNSHTNASTAADIYEVFLTAILDEENNPSVLSFSFAYVERIVKMSGLFDQEILDSFDDLFKFAALKGITICAASGDWGSSYMLPVGSHPVNLTSVSFPAAHPLVLACGGTRIKVENGKILEESVWNGLDYTITMVDGGGKEIGTMTGGASTGGVSLVYPLPGYQENVNVPLVHKGKINIETYGYEPKTPGTGCGVPDVSANADYINSPYLIFYDGNRVLSGGTSASTPQWAGFIARINQGLKHRVGFITPTLYQLQIQGKNVFRKIKESSNGCYIADPDEIWNPCTGLGSPDGKKLLEALKRLKHE